MQKRGPGRPRGAKNKRTAEREQAMREAAAKVEAVLPDAFDGDAHALLIAVYKDTGLAMDLRVDAAKAAIRYEKPALSAIQAQVTGDVAAYVIGGAPMSEAEWAAAYGVNDGENG